VKLVRLVLVAVLTIIVIGLIREFAPNPLKDAMRASDPQLRQRLFALVQPVALKNCTLERFGESHDGGYLLCANLLDGAKGAYSYGISGYDKWGCDVSTRLRVTLHQYDCFDTSRPACPGGNTIFHAECVGDTARTEDGRLFDTMENQFAKNGDAAKRLVVKMDIEGAEWDTLLHASDATLETIDQLAIEFHFMNEERFVSVFQRLHQFFYVAHLHFNNYSCTRGLEPFPAWAYELLLVSKRIGVVDTTKGPPPVSELAARNLFIWPDCQAARP
jgi:hypothetical protein